MIFIRIGYSPDSNRDWQDNNGPKNGQGFLRYGLPGMFKARDITVIC